MVNGKVAVIGSGYVGQAIVRIFKDRYAVTVYDPKLGINLGATAAFINDTCGLAVICVPTDSLPDGSCDTSIVESSVDWLKTPLILIKSAIEPGTADRLKAKTGKRIVVSPEYIGQGKYYIPPHYMHPTDIEKHPFQIFGGDKADTSEAIEWFAPVVGPHVFFYQTTAKCAEVIKVWENAWGAAKVVFANEMRAICEALGVDFWEAREGWALDNRVEKMHSAAFADKRGYNSHCYNKDIPALIRCAEKAGYDPRMLKEVVASNARFNKLNTGDA
jgi:nucleotide sugar dehydrogenase